MKKKKKNIIIPSILTGLVICLSVFSVIAFRNLGRWLIVSDPLPEKLDVIFTFAGENIRVAYSKELTGQYSSAHWVLSDYKDGHSRLLKKNNFDMSRVSVVDTCKNTQSELNFLLQITNNPTANFPSSSALSIGLVSSPYHMRRIKLILKRQSWPEGIRFHFLPVPLDRYKWTSAMVRDWWKSTAVSRSVFSEIAKMIYFLLIF